MQTKHVTRFSLDSNSYNNRYSLYILSVWRNNGNIQHLWCLKDMMSRVCFYFRMRRRLTDSSRNTYFCGQGYWKWTYDPSYPSQANLHVIFASLQRSILLRHFCQHVWPMPVLCLNQGLNPAGSRRIPDPARPSGDLAPKLVDPLEFCSAVSLLVITYHKSCKYAFKTFSFQRVAVVIFLAIERCGNVHKLVVVRIARR